MDNELLTFCDICGRAILCDDEIGDIEQDTYILSGKRVKSIIVKCIDCIDEEGELNGYNKKDKKTVRHNQWDDGAYWRIW